MYTAGTPIHLGRVAAERCQEGGRERREGGVVGATLQHRLHAAQGLNSIEFQ